MIVWSLWWSEFSLPALMKSGPEFATFTQRIAKPEWGVTKIVLTSTLETLTMVLAGTFLGVVIGLPLGFLGAANLTPAWISQPVKTLLGVMRAIPLIVLALLCVNLVGLGPFPGVLALAFHSVGMLGKFYAEAFETVNPGVLQAVSGTGATWLQTLRFGLLPQSIPQFVAFTVYRFENNFRDSAILGFVGAGGVGYYIKIYFTGFQFDKGATLLLFIILVVMALDQVTFWVRRAMR